MISGVGIDMAQVKRFCSWADIPVSQLKKIFSEEEIAYCLKVPRLSAQRFAVRFAVREAFFKALCAMHKGQKQPFLKVCKAVSVVHGDNQVPELQVQWQSLAKTSDSETLIVHCSLTHTHDYATACVIIEQI